MSKFSNQLEQCIPALRRYAFTLFYQQEEADDLVQDCLERALKKQILWQPNSSLRAWLFTIQHNLYVNQLRNKARKPELVYDIDTLVHTLEPHQTDTLMKDIDFCLRHLPEEQRQVLLLVTVEGFRYKEVGKIMDIPLGTVMSRLSRARSTLHDLMNGTTRPILKEVK